MKHVEGEDLVVISIPTRLVAGADGFEESSLLHGGNNVLHECAPKAAAGKNLTLSGLPLGRLLCCLVTWRRERLKMSS